MSPRPRETSDAEILAAAARVMQRLGPAQLTLADVGGEAGVSPATLILRFGTKRELILAVVKAASAQVASQFAAARKKLHPPLKTLIELLVECSGFASTPEAMANGLAYLQLDLTDPDFRTLTVQQFRQIRREIQKQLDEAIAAKELVPSDTGNLARLLQNAYNGSMLAWAIYRQGPLASWVRADLEALLRPLRLSRPRRTRNRPHASLEQPARKIAGRLSV
jgi:AcrR family transcriptional regulator